MRDVCSPHNGTRTMCYRTVPSTVTSARTPPPNHGRTPQMSRRGDPNRVAINPALAINGVDVLKPMSFRPNRFRSNGQLQARPHRQRGHPSGTAGLWDTRTKVGKPLRSRPPPRSVRGLACMTINPADMHLERLGRARLVCGSKACVECWPDGFRRCAERLSVDLRSRHW